MEDNRKQILALCSVVYPLTDYDLQNLYEKLANIMDIYVLEDKENVIVDFDQAKEFLERRTGSAYENNVTNNYNRLLNSKEKTKLDEYVLYTRNYKSYLSTLKPLVELNDKSYQHLDSIHQDLYSDVLAEVSEDEDRVPLHLMKEIKDDTFVYYVAESISYLTDYLTKLDLTNNKNIMRSLDILPLLVLTIKSLYSLGDRDYSKNLPDNKSIISFRDNAMRLLQLNTNCIAQLHLLLDAELDNAKNKVVQQTALFNDYRNRNYDMYDIRNSVDFFNYPKIESNWLNQIREFLYDGFTEQTLAYGFLSKNSDIYVGYLALLKEAIRGLSGAKFGYNVNTILPQHIYNLCYRSVVILKPLYHSEYFVELFREYAEFVFRAEVIPSNLDDVYSFYQRHLSNTHRYIRDLRMYDIIDDDTINQINELFREEMVAYKLKVEEVYGHYEESRFEFIEQTADKED